MCNVCCAGKAIEETSGVKGFATFTRDQGALLMQMEAPDPEFEPGRARFRSARDPEWSAWLDFTDAASFCSRLGLDEKHMPRPVRRYLIGRGARSTVERHVSSPRLRRPHRTAGKRKVARPAWRPLPARLRPRSLFARGSRSPHIRRQREAAYRRWAYKRRVAAWERIGDKLPMPTMRALKQEFCKSGERARCRGQRRADQGAMQQVTMRRLMDEWRRGGAARSG